MLPKGLALPVMGKLNKFIAISAGSFLIKKFKRNGPKKNRPIHNEWSLSIIKLSSVIQCRPQFH